MSLDGTDFRIYEPMDFSPKWYSHKFKGPGLRYEIGLCIKTGAIVWANGGVPCGEYSDLKLARAGYVDAVGPDEMTIADDTYKDANFFIYPSGNPESIREQKRIMARHETVNRRLKQWGVLQKVFRHSLQLHSPCFYAVVNVTQIMFDNNEGLYQLNAL